MFPVGIFVFYVLYIIVKTKVALMITWIVLNKLALSSEEVYIDGKVARWLSLATGETRSVAFGNYFFMS